MNNSKHLTVYYVHCVHTLSLVFQCFGVYDTDLLSRQRSRANLFCDVTTVQRGPVQSSYIV